MSFLHFNRLIACKYIDSYCSTGAKKVPIIRHSIRVSFIIISGEA